MSWAEGLGPSTSSFLITQQLHRELMGPEEPVFCCCCFVFSSPQGDTDALFLNTICKSFWSPSSISPTLGGRLWWSGLSSSYSAVVRGPGCKPWLNRLGAVFQQPLQLLSLVKSRFRVSVRRFWLSWPGVEGYPESGFLTSVILVSNPLIRIIWEI